jgi:hypothetical protein
MELSSGPGGHLIQQHLKNQNEEQNDQKNSGPQILSPIHGQKKYSPPHPLDTKGCCSPQNNP